MNLSSSITRVVVPALALVIGLGIGMIVGPDSSTANGGACQEALHFSDLAITSNIDFATEMANFLGASADNNADAMKAATDALDPINSKTEEAIAGYIDAAANCR